MSKRSYYVYFDLQLIIIQHSKSQQDKPVILILLYRHCSVPVLCCDNHRSHSPSWLVMQWEYSTSHTVEADTNAGCKWSVFKRCGSLKAPGLARTQAPAPACWGVGPQQHHLALKSSSLNNPHVCWGTWKKTKDILYKRERSKEFLHNNSVQLERVLNNSTNDCSELGIFPMCACKFTPGFC